MAKKTDSGVEVLAGGSAEVATRGEGKAGRVAGPVLGDDAPLFDKQPDLPCFFTFPKPGLMAIEVTRATDELEFDRAQAVFFIGLVVAHKTQLRANRRGAADITGDEIEALKDVVIRRGKIVVKFDESRKQHKFNKAEADYLVGRMRPELKRLPLLSS